MLEHHADVRPHGCDGTVAVRAEDAADFVAVGDFAGDADATLLGNLKVIGRDCWSFMGVCAGSRRG